ncbi:cyclin-like protein [Coniochaeta sp. 2T2.1]|nr:cyclin-like protein [Coniochaeta sp. 2T2.1]
MSSNCDPSIDCLLAAEYSDEIFPYMKELERNLAPSYSDMNNQPEITWPKRAILMEWVIKVHVQLRLLPETLFLTINYIDRFLSVEVVPLGRLQLLAAAAIFIAGKYEEVRGPSIRNVAKCVEKNLPIEEILKTERFILQVLDYQLGWPGSLYFLRRINKVDGYNIEIFTLANYFLEVTILHPRFVTFPPSHTAGGLSQIQRLISPILRFCSDEVIGHSSIYDKTARHSVKQTFFRSSPMG